MRRSYRRPYIYSDICHTAQLIRWGRMIIGATKARIFIAPLTIKNDYRKLLRLSSRELVA